MQGGGLHLAIREDEEELKQETAKLVEEATRFASKIKAVIRKHDDDLKQTFAQMQASSIKMPVDPVLATTDMTGGKLTVVKAKKFHIKKLELWG